MKIFDSLFAKKTDKAPISEKLSAMREQTEQKSSEPAKKQPWECLPQDFAVTDTETARQFFFACNGSRTIMEKHFPKEVFSTVIPRNVALSEAPSFGQPAIYYDKKAKGSKAYEELAKEMLKRDKKRKNK